jgi:hypothetical protein
VTEYILVFRGFSRAPSYCHALVSEGDQPTVLVGELADNPGTSVENAVERAAYGVAQTSLPDAQDFALYQFDPQGLPDLAPTFYRVEWGRGAYLDPTWTVVDPDATPALAGLRDRVRAAGYTAQALMEERHLEVVDARHPEDRTPIPELAQPPAAA